MQRQSLNYFQTFIRVAADCPAFAGTVPVSRTGGKSVPALEYEMLADTPYAHTQEDVLFEVHLRHKAIAAAPAATRRQLWDEFFAKSHPCLRASSLAKKYGWGFHFNEKGHVAIYGVESPEYRKFLADPALTQLPAMRNQRAAS